LAPGPPEIQCPGSAAAPVVRHTRNVTPETAGCNQGGIDRIHRTTIVVAATVPPEFFRQGEEIGSSSRGHGVGCGLAQIRGAGGGVAAHAVATAGGDATQAGPVNCQGANMRAPSHEFRAPPRFSRLAYATVRTAV